MQPHWKAGGTQYATIGIELALSVLFGLYAGRWLDQKFGTTWISLVGLALGAAAGFRSLYRMVQRANREAERAEREADAARKNFHDDGPPRDP